MNARAMLGVLLVAALMLSARAEEFVVQVVALKHRTPAELIAALQPLAVKGATVTGANEQLILRSTPANIGELLTVIAALDRPARRLLISLRHDLDAAGYGQDDALAARYHTQADTETIELRSLHTRGAGSERNAYQVQAVDGAPAYIAAGAAVPLADRSHGYAAGYPVVHDSVQYRDLNSGFYVVPRLVGDRVNVEVRPQREQLDANQGGVIDTSAAATTVSGRLGEWLRIGGVNTGYAETAGGLTVSTQRAGERTQSLLIRVDELP